MSRRMRELARSESGLAMPTVLLVTVAALGLGSVAAVSSISAQQGTVRDYDTKLALAAADAGAERALYRYNKILAGQDLPAQTPCLALQGTILVPQGLPAGSEWCSEVEGQVGSATYSYRVKPIVASGNLAQIEVVSTGTSDTVGRRIEVTADTEGPTSANPFSEFSVLSLDDIILDSNSEISGDAATNGSIFLSTNATLCGNGQYGGDSGEGVFFTGNANQCPGYTTGPGEVDLPLVDQGDVVTNNSNGRFFTQDIRQGSNSHVCPGAPSTPKTPQVCWDANTRTLSLDSDTSLTMGGTNYSMCRLVMSSNTDLIIAAGATVRVYFDDPANCPSLPTVNGRKIQMQLDSNSRITVTGGDPTNAAFLFVGSETIPTGVQLNSNSQACDDIILYGPLTDLEMNSNSTICGGVAMNSIHLDSNAEIQSDAGAADFTIPQPAGDVHFTPSRYVECTGATGDPPDANC